MKAQQSYIISVSAGSGCYRHIQISGAATLFDLHTAIIDAFDFFDDHAHAFFMDNRLWSDADSYYADMIEDEERFTKDYKLSKMAFKVGKQFKYVFDFGEEWRFQCKVLRILDEPTDSPFVVRSMGESPNQYGGMYDDFDKEKELKADFPEVYSPKKLKKLYAELGLPSETITLLHNYLSAMSNLYGIIPLRKVLEIINSQNNPISEKNFVDFTEIVRHEEQFYIILGEDELYCDGKPTAPIDRELIEESLICIDIKYYHELLTGHAGKPYYIPPKEKLLRYADEDYYEVTPQTKDMEMFLRKVLKMTAERAEDIFYELIMHSKDSPTSFSDVMDDMNRMGLQFDEDQQLKRFIKLYQELQNHTRMPYNRGYTPNELFSMQPPEDRVPKSMAFGPNIKAALADGSMDIDDFRNNILKMDVPDEQLRMSILAELAKIQNSSTTESVSFKKKKVGPNEPCPCGSGKKYKKCCGGNS